jgi:hypothetical protein|tara:strand:- start:5880 stop:6290 length:411 start_codon:yes stop_codon:yes gene_type:complete
MKYRNIFKNNYFITLKSLFHIVNFLLIIFYLYPGSIFGYLIHGDFNIQPQITNDIFNISSNHIYIFIVISLLGLFAYYKNYLFKVMLFYLFFISIFLELMHLVIPQRGFEIRDLVGNITGIIVSIIIIKIFKKWKN